MSNITYQEEYFEDVIDEIKPLLERHWEEIALNKDKIPLDPDYEAYRKLSDAGAIHYTTVRDDGKLIGYAIYFLIGNLHYSSLAIAESDIFWLAPEYRKGSVGIRLIKAAEKFLVELGVNHIINKVKLHYDVGSLFESLGYKPFERLYSKHIGD